MSFRRAAKIDANQPEVVKFFRGAGFSVLIISQLKNCCDLIVAKNGKTWAVEVKDGSKQPSQRKLSEGEEKFRDEWKGEWRLIETITDCERLTKEL